MRNFNSGAVLEIISSVYHFISAFFVLFFGVVVTIKFGRFFLIRDIESVFLYVWHSLFSLFYLYFVLSSGGDAIKYFNSGLFWDGDIAVGTAAVDAISALLVSGMGMSILGVFLVFNIFGQIGLLAFWGSLKHAVSGKVWWVRYLAVVFVLLPSVSFWSSALGKDAISFMAVGLALWSSLNLSKRGVMMTSSIFVMFLVRPHMAGIMVLAVASASLLDGKTPILRKFFLVFVASGVASVLVPFALDYAGIGEVVDAETVTDYIDKRQTYNMDGGGGVDIASMSLPVKMFTYLFRPFIFEARNAFSLAAGADNIILLFLFVVGGFSMFRGKKSGLNENRTFMWAYSLGSWLILAMTTANLGIALRQKWMFVPMLVFLLISVIGRSRVPVEPGQVSLERGRR
jgi:hypothetical protein